MPTKRDKGGETAHGEEYCQEDLPNWRHPVVRRHPTVHSRTTAQRPRSSRRSPATTTPFARVTPRRSHAYTRPRAASSRRTQSSVTIASFIRSSQDVVFSFDLSESGVNYEYRSGSNK